MYLLQMGHAKVKDFRISAASGAKVLRGAACELFAPAADEDVWYIRHGCAVLSYFRNSALAVCCRGVAAWDEMLLATRLRSRGASKAGADASAAGGATYDEGMADVVAAKAERRCRTILAARDAAVAAVDEVADEDEDMESVSEDDDEL